MTTEQLKNELLGHHRHNHIQFDKDRHEYWYGAEQFKGVTGWIGEYKKPFDREGISKGVAFKTGRTQEEVLEEWDEKLAVSQVYGTGVHDSIEEMIKTGEINPTYEAELMNFNSTIVEHGLVPLACEITVYNEDVRRASNIDLVCERDGELVIVDFKTPEKGIKFEAYKNQKMMYPISELPDASFWHYSLQLDIYAYWLEKKYGLPVAPDKWIMYLRGEECAMHLTDDVREQTIKLHTWNSKRN